MQGLASLLMIAVIASWIAARQSRQHRGDGLEWTLLSVLPATAALLLFLEAGDTATALRLWLSHLLLCLLALGAWSLRTLALLPHRAWTVVGVAVLAAGLVWTRAAGEAPTAAADKSPPILIAVGTAEPAIAPRSPPRPD